MRRLFASACLLVASLEFGQAAPVGAVKFTKFILGVADLDRSYAFYHALGLELDNNATALGKPSVLPDVLLKLVDVPAGTKFRNMMLKIPRGDFQLEVTEFTGMEVHPSKPRIQDPGAALLSFVVGDVDAALAIAKKAGAEVVTKGGSPVGGADSARKVIVKDPDGYYVEFTEVPVPDTSGKIFAGVFGSMVVADVEKTAFFYRDRLGLVVSDNRNELFNDNNGLMGAPGTQVRGASVRVPATILDWTFAEFKGVDRKAQTPRIPDPGAAAVGLQVRDIDAAIAAVKAAGGSSITQGGSVKLGNSKVGFVRDPSGILVELTQP
jgi:catechol 2,3-dioxygenase-like lactoylglutathione lyase family enzyme